MTIGDYVKIRIGPKGVGDYGERIWVKVTDIRVNGHRGHHRGTLSNDPVTAGFQFGQQVDFTDAHILDTF